MRLVAWNVNGLRAILKKGFEEAFRELDPDIMSLGEIKLSDYSNFPFSPEGYEVYYTISKVKKGYSGVAVFTKRHPLSYTYGLADGRYDEEGRVVTLEYESFYFVGVYSPNSQESLARLPFRIEYEERLRDYLVKLDRNKPVILAGDLNVAHNPIDLKNAKQNEGATGYTLEERTSFGALLEAGFTDSFRYLYPEKVEYSWWSYRFKARERNIGWRIDYFIVSNKIKDKIKDSSIKCEINGSDHCPILLDIDLSE